MPASVGVGVLAICLAAVHLFAGRIRSLQMLPRSWWLSAGSGVSVAYVFVHLLPEITERQSRIMDITAPSMIFPLATREHLLFIAVLTGFAAYYGVEQLAQCSQRQSAGRSDVGGADTRTSAGVFWLHIGAFAAYNFLIGYLLVHREIPGTTDLLLYVAAMAMHFLVNDHGLRQHHQDAYHDIGRWILAASVIVGLLVGLVLGVPELLLSLLFAFLAGAIVLNVIKEELPEERRSRFGAFATGVVGYSAMLLAV